MLHVDNALVVSDEAEHPIRNEIGQHFVANKEHVGQPTRH